MNALRKHLEGLPRYQREELRLDRWGDVGKVADRFGSSAKEVRAILGEIDRAEAADGQGVLRQWREAVLLNQAMSATEKIAALRVECFVNAGHRYAWPSQDRLAKELGYSRGPNLGKALKRAFEVGALTPITIKNLPPDVLEQAAGASNRSLRGVAYRLNPVERWKEEAAAFAALQKCNMFHGGTLEGSKMHHLNYEGNYEPAAQDSSSHIGALPGNVSCIETSHDCSDPTTAPRSAANG